MSEINPHVARMVNELADLEDKAEKLNAFLSGGVFQTISKVDQRLLVTQFVTMNAYANILHLRIDLASE